MWSIHSENIFRKCKELPVEPGTSYVLSGVGRSLRWWQSTFSAHSTALLYMIEISSFYFMAVAVVLAMAMAMEIGKKTINLYDENGKVFRSYNIEFLFPFDRSKGYTLKLVLLLVSFSSISECFLRFPSQLNSFSFSSSSEINFISILFPSAQHRISRDGNRLIAI